MKRANAFFFTFVIIGLFFLIPEKSAEELNDIEEGTIIYGEDISELSEEELQYIPKSWREGNFEPEHEHEEELQNEIIMPFSAYPNVNSYIKNITPKNTTYQYKDFFTKFNYRNGYGAVEGVVAHETANDSSNIHQEISYMSRNHQNAFVHAFVDHNNVIEIHPPDYGAWGAGRFANQRFVHVELVRVNNFDQFAKSINNYANYIASILYDYNLGVSSAENSGKGTLWSHKAVSIHLGGTTHVDPHGYFARYGYNWNQFVSLVNEKYNKIVTSKKQNTSKLAHINSSNVKKYDNPTTLSGESSVGNSNIGKVFYIKSEAIVNGSQYYLLSNKPSSKEGVLGWIKASDLSTAHSHVGVDNKSKTLITNGRGNAYAKAWGGEKDLVYNLSDYAGEEFTVNKTERVGNNTWYRGYLNGKQVFIHEAYVETKNEKSTSRLGHLRSSEALVYETLGNSNTATKAGADLTSAVYYIKKQADIGSERYYLLSTKPSSKNGVVGWVKSSDLSTHTHVGVNTESKKLITNGRGNAYAKAWGGDKDLVYNLSDYAGEEFTVNKTERVGNNTWYRGHLNGKQVFIHEAYVETKKESNISRLGHLRSSEALVYETLGNPNTATKAGTDLTSAVYYIKKQADIGSERYYLLSTKPSSENGVIGWVKSSDLSTHTHVGVDKKSKKLITNGRGKAYAKAWGGDKDLVYNLSDYAGEEFTVNKTERVGNNTWYRGYLKGKQVFIHEAYVEAKNEKSTSRLGHLRSSEALVYGTLGNSNTATKAGADLTSAVYYIKKQADIGSERYYLLSTKPSSENGVIGWVKSSDLSTHTHVGVDKKTKKLITNGRGKAYSKAWGGEKDLVYNLPNYVGEEFTVNKTERVGNNTWYRGHLNGEQVFIHEAYVD